QPVPGSGGTTLGSVPPGGVPASALAPISPSKRNPQPPVVVPDGAVTIWYLEDGFETITPPSRQAAYTGKEANPYLVPALIYREVTTSTSRDQSSQIRDALELAYCQPAVGAFFNFQLSDERDLRGWQSGLLWADGTKKPSYEIVKQAIAAIAAGTIACSLLRRAVPGLGYPGRAGSLRPCSARPSPTSTSPSPAPGRTSGPRATAASASGTGSGSTPPGTSRPARPPSPS